MDFGYNLTAEILKCEMPSYDHTEEQINRRIEVLERVNAHLDDLRRLQEILAQGKREKKKIDYREDVNTQLLMEKICALNPAVFKDLTYSHIIELDQIDGLMTSSENMIKSMETRHTQATMYLTQAFTERRSKEEIFGKTAEMSQQEGRTWIANQRGAGG